MIPQGELFISEKIFLRRFEKSDAPRVKDILSDADVGRYLGIHQFDRLADAEEYLEKNYLSRYRAADSGILNDCGLPIDCRFAICRKEDGELVGRIGIASMGPSNNIGFYLAHNLWGHGYMHEAMKLMLRIAEQYRYPYLTGCCNRLNSRSAKVLLRAGMTYRYSWQDSSNEINDLYQCDFRREVTTYTGHIAGSVKHWSVQS